MYMKKFLFICLICSLSVRLLAQNELFSRQYFLNNYLVNPAVGGIHDYMDARLSYSRQWTAIENSPSSVLLTFNTNLSKEKDQVLRYSYADRKYRIGKGHLDYNYRCIKHGVGLKATYDKVNVFNYTDVLLSYACHVPLNPYFTLSVGIGGGMSLSTLDVTGNYIGNSDDPLLNAGKRNEITPVLEAGIWLYTTGPYIGMSLSKYMEDPYDEDGKTRYNNIYATAGWQLVFRNMTFTPSLMYCYNGYSGEGLDIHAVLWFYDVVWAGASLRKLENPSAHVGLLLGNRVEINYTYDINKSEWGGSHEIGIAYRIWKRADDCKNKWYFR
jgi:type IX secretion system PorP/SprF family membrane protein